MKAATVIEYFQSFIPLQWYYVKKMARPKGKKDLLTVLMLFTYGLGLGLFIALYVTQSRSYTTETSIQVSDISDDNWSCSMASYVTQSVEIDGSSNPSQFFELLNINEVQSSCLESLKESNPCGNASNFLFSPGSTSTIYDISFVSVSPIPTADSSTFYFTSSVSSNNDDTEYLQAYRYNVEDGTMTASNYGPFGFLFSFSMYSSTSVAMDKSGQGYFLGYDDDGFLFIFDFDGLMTEDLPCDDSTTCGATMLTNDNFYNLYLGQLSIYNDEHENELTLYSFSNSNNNDDDYLDLRLSKLGSISIANLTFVRLAVYNGGSESKQPSFHSLYIYYVTNEFNLYVYYQGTSTLLLGISAGIVQYIQISQSNMVYASITESDDDTEYNLLSSVTFDGLISNIATFTVNTLVFQMVLNDSQVIFNSNVVTDAPLLQYTIETQLTSEILYGFSGSTAGWYTCGDTIVTSGLPDSVNSISVCSLNGISLMFEYTGEYYATEDLFGQQARSYAYKQCNSSIYDTICDRVGNLPPYICSRKQYLPFFTVVATALANSHLVVVVVFSVIGSVLARMDKYRGNKDANDKDSLNDVELRQYGKE